MKAFPISFKVALCRGVPPNPFSLDFQYPNTIRDDPIKIPGITPAINNCPMEVSEMTP